MPVVRERDDRNERVSPELRLDMENDIEGTRWVIPRPSLANNVSGSESSKISRGLPTKSRGSASSQGSSSNHSTHSASSGSLLLSAANLSKINELHTSSRHSHSSKVNNYQNNLTAYVHSSENYLANNEKYPNEDQIDIENNADPFWNNVKLASAKSQRKEDNQDAESVASSTHFTVVNGFTRHGKSIKNDSQMWCCKSSHQITVLIITMTILFTAGLLAAICYVEMRQRREDWSKYS